MAKGDPKKPKGKMSAYAFFVQTYREEHKEKNPDIPDNVAEFSKKCSEKWKTMPGKEKSKFDETAKTKRVRYDREIKDMDQLREARRQQTLMPKGQHLDSSRSVQNAASGSNPQTLASLLEMWQSSWKRYGITSGSEKQPYSNNKAAKPKEKHEKDAADSKSKGKLDGAKCPTQVTWKKVEKEDREDKKEEEEQKTCLSASCEYLRVGESHS